MRKRGYKLTGFAKFMILLIFAAPIAYMVAAYSNGQDPLNEVRNWEIFKRSEVKKEAVMDTEVSDEKSYIKELELKDLEINQLKEKVGKLEELIDVQKREIAKLKNQINDPQSQNNSNK